MKIPPPPNVLENDLICIKVRAARAAEFFSMRKC